MMSSSANHDDVTCTCTQRPINCRSIDSLNNTGMIFYSTFIVE